MELFYLTNAFSFFVGWAWISFLRDLQVWLAAQRTGPISYETGAQSIFSHTCRCSIGPIENRRGPISARTIAQTLVARIASSSDLLSGGAAWSYLSEALCATAFGPGLTWLLVRSRQRWGGGRHAWQALLAKVEELEVSLHDTEEVYAVQSSRAAESSARCEVLTAGDTAAQPEPPRDDSFRLELPAPREAAPPRGGVRR